MVPTADTVRHRATWWDDLGEKSSQLGNGVKVLLSPGATEVTGWAFELSDLFNGFRCHPNQTCWVPRLEAGERARLDNHFNNVLRTDPRFISSWQTNTRQGQLAVPRTPQHRDVSRWCPTLLLPQHRRPGAGVLAEVADQARRSASRAR